MSARRTLRPRCTSSMCGLRGFHCSKISEEERLSILNSFYDMADVSRQRAWLAMHVLRSDITKRRPNVSVSRKHNHYNYHIPLLIGSVQVCRIMFLNTVGISERQIRTTMAKIDSNGVLAKECRGGRPEIQRLRDERLKEEIISHINRFPRVESHYCRAKTSYEYLASDLTISLMYKMYITDVGLNLEDPASFALYYKTFKTLKLKFHKPKKDMCGICATFNNGNEEERSAVNEKYQKHKREKDKVRQIKKEIKKSADTNPALIVASFDLQQVLYIPRTNRCEIFYKRRLACYNFTIFELNKKVGHCYVWHECIARRGSNEVASHVHNFLMDKDSAGYADVVFFADGCGGQNKNSILPTMFSHFVKHAQCIRTITLMFFETNHGQNEGDSVHSTIERALKRHGNMYLPSELSSVIKVARSNPAPYLVHDIETSDINDWKAYSKQLGVLRVRVSDQGSDIDWTKFMQIRIQKDHPNQIMYKTSHEDRQFSSITIGHLRRGNGATSSIKHAFTDNTKPCISSGKYLDLTQLCSGITPAIPARYHGFYNNLPH